MTFKIVYKLNYRGDKFYKYYQFYYSLLIINYLAVACDTDGGLYHDIKKLLKI